MTKRITDAIVGRPATPSFPDPATMEATTTVPEKPKRKSRAKVKKTGFSGRTMADGLRYIITGTTITRIDDKKCEKHSGNTNAGRRRFNAKKLAIRAAIRAQFGE
jgi:hypothetical protein